MQPRARRRSLHPTVVSFVVLLLLASGVTAAEASLRAWVPPSASTEPLNPPPRLLYQGMEGRLLEIDGAQRAAAEALGATVLETSTDEVLFVYLVRDASRAEFETPARVLLRAGHEAIVAMPGPRADGREPALDPGALVPRLTEASRATQHGLQQPVRIDGPVRAEPRAAAPLAAPERTRDPLIEQMVGALTGTNFQPTWQTLDDFETRYAYAAQNNAATQWLLDQFLAMDLSAEFHYFQDGGTRRNVIATLPGLVDPSRVVYICAHLDATSGTPTVCAPGADDNGSGTAAVVEAARVLRQYQFEYTIKFACFNNEEQGLIGSAAYAADMDAANEDIVAVYNCDMIAYRGTDPAPPDLVVYTNNNSQSVASILETCINTYVGGLIEPMVIVQALSGSDHASFWDHGYRAVCSIEDEAWGADFCPWYHTCNDRIEQYPQDYVLHCAKANLAAVATTAIPFLPQGPYLVVDSSTVDDDANGGSEGDGNGVLNPGETIELWVDLRNIGTQGATAVTGRLTTTSPSVTLLDDQAAWSDIPAGGSGTNLTALRFQVAVDVGDGEVVPFTLIMTDAAGSRSLPLQFVAASPRLDYYTHWLDDTVTGNGNGIIDPGEVIRLTVRAANAGGQDAQAVTALLSTANPRLTVLDGAAGTALIPAHAQADLAPAYRLLVAGDAAEGEVLILDLALATAAGYQAVASFPIQVGTAYYDEVEFDGPWTLGAPDDDASTGQWVRVDPVGSVQNGNQAQTEDDHTTDPGVECFVTGQGAPGGAAGAADVDGGKTTLTSPIFDLRRITNPQITYWRWYTNNLGNNPGADSWVVQVSSNGGTTWIDLERTTASANSWTERSFALNAYITPSAQVVFRFIASDASPGSLVEAAVDDIEIGGTMAPVAVEAPGSAAVLSLARPEPNPTRGATAIRFSVPSPSDVSLRLFSVDGRLVRTLYKGRATAGPHRIDWDGRDGMGHAVTPGVYFCRLQAGGRSLGRRLVVAG